MLRYKKLEGGLICQIEVTGKHNEDRTNVFDKEHAIFRCSEAKVIKIYHMDTKEEHQTGASLYCKSFFYSQGTTIKIEDYDNNKEKAAGKGIHYYLNEIDAYWHCYEPKSDFTGIIRTYEFDGNLSNVLSYVRGQFEGECIRYKKGKIFIKRHYVQGKIEGENIGYDKNGNILEKCNFIQGEIEGEVLFYYPNGKIRGKVNMKKSLKNGKGFFYYENGQTSVETNFINDLRQGIENIYFEDGKTEVISFYIDGLKQGIEKLFHPNGVLYAINNFVDNKFDGIQEAFYDNGNKKFIHNYTMGEKKGKQIDYDEDGYVTETEL